MTTLSQLQDDLYNTIIATATFLIALIVYTITLTPAVPFWDGGEYIATSYILGIPHAPGTPLYVLIGRVFSMIPIGTIAQRVNWLSAFSSAIAVLFTYLITVKLARKTFTQESSSANRPMSYVAGVVAAFLAAFATTFWDNAIEAEVYAGACALMTFCIWLVLRWQERLGDGHEDGLLLVITYIVGLGVGIHLGVAIAAWAAVLFVFVVRPDYLKKWNYLGWAICTLSLGAGINKLTFMWAPAVLVVTVLLYLLTGKLRKLALWSSLLFVLGLSVHFYLLIRSNLDPAINEGAPKDLEALWLMLTRDQYRPYMFPRKATWGEQIDYMWLRYMWDNFTLFMVKGRQFFQVPILLAVTGAVVHFVRDRRTFVVPFVLFMFLGPAMVLYLNFSATEVRERDYFYVQNFQFMCIWIGLGAIWVAEQLRMLAKGAGAKRLAVLGAGILFLVMAVLPMVHNWESHDRRGFYFGGRLRPQHAEDAAAGRHDFYQRRQRHLLFVVRPGSRRVPKGRAGSELESPQHQLVHQTA